MKKTIWILTFALLPFLTIAQGINFIDNDLEGSMKKAKEENKILFVDAYTTWCGPCKWLAANVFTNDTLGSFYNSQFVNLKLDMEKGAGVEFAKQYEVQAFPSLLFIHPSGEVVNKVLGAYPSTSTWMKAATEALNPFESLSYLESTYSSKLENTFYIAEYTERLQKAGKSTSEVLGEFYARNSQELMRYDIWQITKKNSHNENSIAIDDIIQKYDSYIKKYGSEPEDVLLDIYLTQAFQIIRTDGFKIKALDSYVQSLKERGIPVAVKVEFISKLFVFENEKKWKDYEALALRGTDEFANSDAEMLNAIAWNFYENVSRTESLEKAQSWAARAYKLEPLSSEILDTEAHVLFKIGNIEGAVEKAQMALKLAEMKKEDTTSYKEALSRFQAAAEK